ncbi:MAG TPA: hypothetical protein VL358_01325 [Caulobacteraceae bacterium]|jgi:hypothetical protein|nr:hypothetical protein [Caulobacteraceae bacterium]
MNRAFFFALSTSTALAAGAAQAQQICCVAQPPPPPPPQVCCVGAPAQPAGLRGYADPQYAPPPYSTAQYGGPPPPYATSPYGGPPPAYAQPQYAPRPAGSGPGLRGYVGVEYGKSRLDPGTPSPRTETWTGEAAASGQLGGIGIQGDIKVANYNTLGSDAGGTSWSPTLHAYQRNAYGLIGGWAGWSHTDGADLFGLGLEGQAYMGGATIYGSVGYGHVDSSADQNLWTARLEGRYFVTENFSLNVNGGLVRAGVPGARETVRTIGFGGEYQPSVLPFSIQGGYSHADASGSSAESNTFRVGLRWNFDGSTLVERDHSGPSLVNITDQFQSN